MKSIINRVAAFVCLAGIHNAASAQLMPTFIGSAELQGSQLGNPCAIGNSGAVGYLQTQPAGDESFPAAIRAIDLTTGTVLSEIGMLDITGAPLEAQELLIEGDRLYLLPSLMVIDISDPEQPEILGQGPSQPSGSRAAVQDGILYVIASAFQVRIYDCTEPSSIALIGQLSVFNNGTFEDIESTNDGRIIFGKGQGGVAIYDSSDPGTLSLLGRAQGFTANDVQVIGDNIYAAVASGRGSGITGVSMATPETPSIIGSYSYPSSVIWEHTGAMQSIGTGAIAYILEEDRIDIFDVSTPSSIQLDTSISSRTARMASFRGSLLLATEDGIQLYEFPSLATCPADFNDDGVLNFFDVSQFIVAYSSMDPIADLTGDGSFNFFDVSAFLTMFTTGCP